jgi:ABC-type antimicrobial peptide transport system permease subunit
MDVPAKRYDIEIAGVVKDFKFNEPRQDLWPVVFLPLLQLNDPNDRMRYAASLDVRTSGNPSSVAAAIKTAVQDVDRNLPITGVTTVKAQLDEALTKERLIAKLSVFFSLLSLVLASLGLYGVMSYAISRRTGEIGIRMAMGAARGDVARMVVREILLVAVIGVSIGVTAAVAGTRLIEGQLFGLAATDPVTISLAAVVMIAVSLAAGYLPARRASRVDPMVALRHE